MNRDGGGQLAMSPDIEVLRPPFDQGEQAALPHFREGTGRGELQEPTTRHICQMGGPLFQPVKDVGRLLPRSDPTPFVEMNLITGINWSDIIVEIH
jgi:hypothetical protein